MTQVAVKLTKVSKKYILAHEKPGMVKNIFGRKTKEEFWALKNINLNIKKGEKVGIVGPNGAGKTTLLKIISGITTPTAGKVTTKGKIVSLLNLQAGFHPELTGEENLYLNGLLIGMDKGRVKRKKRQIVALADIGKFIDAPFYTYSAGMKFRLAFAVAIASQCDVLLIDEIFVAGDNNFQRKIYSSLNEVQKNRDITTIVTSHISFFTWDFANKFYKIERGRLKSMSSKEMLSTMKSERKRWLQAFPILKDI